MKYLKTLSLAALAVLAVACKSDDKAGTAQQAKPQVKIAKVTSEDIPQTETYTATVESDVKNDIAPNTPYRIESCRWRTRRLSSTALLSSIRWVEPARLSMTTRSCSWMCSPHS